MHAINLIARHIDRALITDTIHQVDTVCAFTGERITEGIKKKDAIGTNFTDFAYIKHESDYVSLDFVLCTKDIFMKVREEDGLKLFSGLRNFSFIATETELRFLKREEILQALLSINETPFVVCVTEGGKKHLTFKSSVNQDVNTFVITTDFGDILFSQSQVANILPVIQKWYSIMPKGKQEATWFNKEEIFTGQPKMSKIVDYGIDTYTEEYNALLPYFNSPLMQLLTFILNKTK